MVCVRIFDDTRTLARFRKPLCIFAAQRYRSKIVSRPMQQDTLQEQLYPSWPRWPARYSAAAFFSIAAFALSRCSVPCSAWFISAVHSAI